MRRRQLMKSIGIGAVATPAAIGGVNAEDEYISMTDAGVEDEVRALLSENKFDKAQEVLDESNVEYTITRNKYHSKNAVDDVGEGHVKEEYSGNEVSIENRHDQDESETHLALIHDEDDTWVAAASFDIVYGVFSAQNSEHVDDVMSLSWKTDAWQPKEASDDNLTFNVYQDRGSPATFPSGHFDSYGFEGVSGTVEYSQASSYNGVFQTDINRLNGTNEMVLFEFKNTYAYSHTLINSISFGLPGGLEAEFGGQVERWTLPASDTPD